MPEQRENSRIVNQPFVILRDCRQLYLKLISQLLQEGDRLPEDALDAFQREAGAFFDEMTSPQRKSGFQEAVQLTASCISLVAENDLEIEIRLGEFTARLLEKSGGELWQVYLRFVTLLQRPDLSTADNPVGPKGIAKGLGALCRVLNENHEKTLAHLTHLENYFADHLSVIYRNLDDFLAGKAVDAAQPAVITSPSAARTGISETRANPAAALQRNLLGPQFSNIYPSGDNPGSFATAALYSQAMLDRLLTRLDELECSLPYAANSMSLPSLGQASLETLIPGLFTEESADVPKKEMPRSLKSSELGVAGNAPEAATIDALALIFEAIFASEQLPDAIKSVLSSLQIPLLKAAMLDATFFTTEHHPARDVIDKIAYAALGLPHDVPASHPLCTSLQSIAGRLRSELSRDMHVFEKYAGALDSLISGREQSIRKIAGTYTKLLPEFQRRYQAAIRSRKIIDQFHEQQVPASISRFLHNHWSVVLEKDWLDGGEQSASWQKNIEVIKELLWSVQPKSEIDGRKQLAKILPGMLRQLNEGMAQSAVPENVMAEFLDDCFALQTAAMRGVTNTAQTADTVLPAPVERLTSIASDSLILKTCLTNEATSSLPALRTGDWVEFDYAGQLHQGCLIVVPDSESCCLLVNPEWSFSVAMSFAAFNRQLAEKRACPIAISSLFNSAAEKALHNTPKKDVLA